VIAAAEQHAALCGGWSRRYSVPTTDLHVHNVPVALDILNRALERRIFPALAEQYSVPVSRLRVLDAFIVKYAFDGQRELPLHRDQSIFSATLALNDVSCFDGGGTWFEAPHRAISPHRGCFVTFPGSAVHGGRAITRGTRYIIALFLYAV